VPEAAAVGAAAFVLVLAVSRFVSLGSVAGTLAAAGWLFWSRREAPPAELLPVGLLVGALGAAVVVRHLPNLGRIAAGTEPRVFAGKEPPRGA
jgi:glycerol-3-phosphate acyltransferase PlsY